MSLFFLYMLQAAFLILILPTAFVFFFFFTSTTCFFIQYRFLLEAQQTQRTASSQKMSIYFAQISHFTTIRITIFVRFLSLSRFASLCTYKCICSFQNEMDLNRKKWEDDKNEGAFLSYFQKSYYIFDDDDGHNRRIEYSCSVFVINENIEMRLTLDGQFSGSFDFIAKLMPSYLEERSRTL